MARIKRCLGIDLGSSTVKIAELAFDGAGARVIHMLSEPLPVGPDAAEEERNNAIVSVVRGIIKKNKIPTKAAVFCMPGQTVFVRRVRLPRASGASLNRIVYYEARQLIPFPLEKTLVEFQVFETEKEREVEVLLVAMKRETNAEFMRLVRRTGLQPMGISITTLGLFNGQQISRFNPQELAKKSQGGGLLGGLLGKKGAAKPKKDKKKGKTKKGEAEEEAPVEEPAKEENPSLEEETSGMGEFTALGAFEEVKAYINIGARSTDLAICKPGQGASVGFIRSIPLGGNHITLAIQKACGLETFTQAETMKIEKSAARSGAFEFEADKSKFDEKACMAATQVCDRLISEIRRSLDYFISQPDGVGVDVAVLSGGSSHMAFLPGYIEERLGMPVEVSSKLGNEQIKCPSQYAEEFDYSPYKIAVGLASQGLGISQLTVDFLPPDIRSMRDFSGQYAEFGALAGVIALMVGISSQLGSTSAEQISKNMAEASSFVDKNKPLQDKLTGAETKRGLVQSKLDVLSDVLPQREYWLRFLSRIYETKPARVLLTKVECKPNYKDPKSGMVEITGEAEQLPTVISFINELNGRKPDSKDKKSIIEKAKLITYQEEKSEHFATNVARKFLIQIAVQDEDGKPLTRLDKAPMMEAVAAAGTPGAPTPAAMGVKPAAGPAKPGVVVKPVGRK